MIDNQACSDPKTRHVNVFSRRAIVGADLQLFLSGSGIPKFLVVVLILEKLNQYYAFLVGLEILRNAEHDMG